jgi:hypothetical protein
MKICEQFCVIKHMIIEVENWIGIRLNNLI